MRGTGNMDKQCPILIDTSELNSRIGDSNVQIIDLSESSDYRSLRIPNSMRVSPRELYNGTKPTPGSVPSKEHLRELMSRLGLREGLQVIAYDDEGGGHASRLIWTLHLLNYHCGSVLNGGIQSWLADGLPTVKEDTKARRSHQVDFGNDDSVIANQDYIKARLGTSDLILLDARTPEEYKGIKVFAKRGGHIPGAVNLNWLNSINTQTDFRLKGKQELEAMLLDRNITPDKEIVVYCQTHHRSAQSWMMLRYLGYPKVRGYPGSWSEWGNDLDVRIEH
jgi:thiosulfate/3-mercaptopyruvate sulfurtransferase